MSRLSYLLRTVPPCSLECCSSVCQAPGLLGYPGRSRRCWPLRPVHLPFECQKRRLSLYQWSYCPRLNQTASPPPTVGIIPLHSLPLELCQDHLVVCVHPRLSHPCVGKNLSDRAKNVVPLPRHLRVLSPHPPGPAPVSYVPPTWHEVVRNFFQSAVRHHHFKFFLPRITWLS